MQVLGRYFEDMDNNVFCLLCNPDHVAENLSGFIWGLEPKTPLGIFYETEPANDTAKKGICLINGVSKLI